MAKRMMRAVGTLGLMAVGLVVAGAAAGCQSPNGSAADLGPLGTKPVQITSVNYRYDPIQITALPGQRLLVTLANNGSSPHSIRFDLPGGDAELTEPVEPGDTGRLEVTAPAKAGTYAYYSPLADHRKHGMEGRLVVAAPAEKR